MVTPVTREQFALVEAGTHVLLAANSLIWSLVDGPNTLSTNSIYMVQNDTYEMMWSSEQGGPHIIIKTSEGWCIETSLNQSGVQVLTRDEAIREKIERQKWGPKLPQDDGDYDRLDVEKNESPPSELRGNPFIDKFGWKDTPQNCGYCFFREMDGRRAIDCLINTHSAKRDFDIPTTDIMPKQIDGVEVGFYCKHWVHFAAE